MFQKKKKPEIIPQLSELELASYKTELSNKEDNLSYVKISDIDIKDLLPLSFEDVLVSIEDGLHVLYLSDVMTGDKYRSFKRKRGYVFNKDVLNYSRNKKSGKYVLIQTSSNKKVVRLVEDDELSDLKHFKLIDGIIKDMPYIIMQTYDKDTEIYSYTRDFNSLLPFINDEESVICNVPITTNKDNDEDYEPVSSSISLFDD